MSTKINNGYYLPPMDMFELTQLMGKFKNNVRNKCKELYAKEMTEMMTFMVDSKMLCSEEDFLEKCSYGSTKITMDDSAYTSTLYIVNDRFYDIKKLDIKDPDCDFYCEVVLKPIKDKILCILIAEKDIYKKAWESIPGVKPYFFWDNTDKPTDISNDDWQKRGDDWRSASVGFVFSCIHHPPYFDEDINEMIEAAIPSLDSRVANYARGMVYKTKMKELISSEEHPYNYFRVANKWINDSEDGQKALLDKKKDIEKKLIKDLSIGVFLEKFKDIKA